MARSVTRLNRLVVWSDLCRLGQYLCLMPPGTAKPWLLYIHSLGTGEGKRVVEPNTVKPAHIVPDPGFKGEWRGYSAESGLILVRWVSSSQFPAALQAAPERGKKWKLTYLGPEAGHESSRYLSAFGALGNELIWADSFRGNRGQRKLANRLFTLASIAQEAGEKEKAKVLLWLARVVLTLKTPPQSKAAERHEAVNS